MKKLLIVALTVMGFAGMNNLFGKCGCSTPVEVVEQEKPECYHTVEVADCPIRHEKRVITYSCPVNSNQR